MGTGTLRKINSIQILLLLVLLGRCQQREYLQSTVRTLRNLRNTLRRADVADVKSVNLKQNHQNLADKRFQFEEDPPPLSLTKGELTELYEQSLANGQTVKLDTGDNDYINAAVHEIDDSHANVDFPGEETHERNPEESGYYYYYYPLNSFLGENHAHQVETFEEHPIIHKPVRHENPVQAHWHTHQHNITISKPKETKKFSEKLMEPLFMAVSGFLGMALMTFLTTVLMPKHDFKNITKPKNSIKSKGKTEGLDDFAKFALDALDGRCAERFACEMTKTARSFNLEDNRFFKLIRRMVPGGSEMEKAKYLNQQLQCTAIPCTPSKPPVQFYFADDNYHYYNRENQYYDNRPYFDPPNNYNYNQNRRNINKNNYFDNYNNNNNQNRRINNQQPKKNNNQNRNTHQKKNNQNKNNSNNTNNNNKKKNASNKKNNNKNRN